MQLHHGDDFCQFCDSRHWKQTRQALCITALVEILLTNMDWFFNQVCIVKYLSMTVIEGCWVVSDDKEEGGNYRGGPIATIVGTRWAYFNQKLLTQQSINKNYHSWGILEAEHRPLAILHDGGGHTYVRTCLAWSHVSAWARETSSL